MKRPVKTLIDLEMLNTLSEGCPGCGNKFTLGETVVLACGAWEGGPKYIHESESVYDSKTSSFVERKCYEAKRSGG
jgi:hypothetical protein